MSQETKKGTVNTNPQGEGTNGNPAPQEGVQEVEKVGFFARIGAGIDNWAKHPISNTVNGVKKAGGWMKDHPVQTAVGAGVIGYAGYKAYQHFHSEEDEETVEAVEVPEDKPELPGVAVLAIPVIEKTPEPEEVPEEPVLEENPTEGVFDEVTEN